MFLFLELAPELQNIILSFVNNTHSICQSRLVCRKWWKFWEKVPLIEDFLTLGYFIMEPKIFKLVDLNNKIIRELKFKSYGRWIYQEFNSNGGLLRKIENKSFFMTQSNDYSNDFVQTIRKVDARAGTINEVKIPRNIIGPQCVIS